MKWRESPKRNHGTYGLSNFSVSKIILSSIQRNTVLPCNCKLRISDSRNFWLFCAFAKYLFHEHSSFVIFQSFKAATLATILLWFKYHVIRPKTLAIEACILSATRIKRGKPKPQLGAFGPSKSFVFNFVPLWKAFSRIFICGYVLVWTEGLTATIRY